MAPNLAFVLKAEGGEFGLKVAPVPWRVAGDARAGGSWPMAVLARAHVRVVAGRSHEILWASFGLWGQWFRTLAKVRGALSEEQGSAKNNAIIGKALPARPRKSRSATEVPVMRVQ